MIQSLASAAERHFIKEASLFLEAPAQFLSFAEIFSQPLERLKNKIPEATRRSLHLAVDHSLKTALKIAIETIQAPAAEAPDWETGAQRSQMSSWAHTAAATTTGALGGAFGMAALVIELPITTSIILRSISSAAQEWGHDLSKAEIQMHCLSIFALGSPRSDLDDATESLYFASRIAFQKIISEMSTVIGSKAVPDLLLAIERESLPVFIKFFSLLAPAFEKTVMRKVIVEAIPFIGAIGGAAINAAFCNYFSKAARFHFGLMHLEQKYGADLVREYYEIGSNEPIEAL